MKSVLLVAFFIGLNNVVHSQKISFLSENIAFEIGFVYKDDSVAAEIKMTNLSAEKICIPVLHNSLDVPQYELSSIGGTLDIRVGISSRFSGMPLEFTAILRQIGSQETVKFVSNYVKRTEVFEAVASFDFIRLDDVLRSLKKKTLEYKAVIKGSEYVSLARISRVRLALPHISYY